MGGYIVYESFIKDNNKNNNNNNNNNNGNTIKEDIPKTDNTVSKINNDKEWIYDAEYTKTVNASSYKTQSGTYYAKDIIVPYINIKSDYATSANNEIKKVFDDAINKYNEGIKDKLTYVDPCNYKKYITSNYASVILSYGVGATDVVHPKYYAYNIDLKIGNKLSYKEVYETLGFNSSNIDSKVETAITNTMKEKLKNFSDDEIKEYNTKSINNYKNSVNDNSLIYFISEDGKLNVVVKLIIPASTGEFDTIIKVD